MVSHPVCSFGEKEQGLLVKALLLLDNAPAYPEATSIVSKEGDIKATYLPPCSVSANGPRCS